MLCQLLAWNAGGEVVAHLDHMVALDEHGHVVGLIDFAAHEDAGGSLKDIWIHSAAVGSATWPEWIGNRAHDFRVELESSPAPARARIKALVHKRSGHRRERAAVEKAIADRIAAAIEAERPADLRDLVGGPNRPLRLDEHGRNLLWEPMSATETKLPIVRAQR